MSDLSNRDDIGLHSPPGSAPAPFARLELYTQALRRMKSKILSGADIDVVLQAVCSEVTAVVPGADMVGITVLDESGRPNTVASTDSTVHYIDSDQYRTGEGPSLEAAVSGRMVRAQADEARAQWPRFAAAAADLGVDSYLAAPFALDERRSGSLNIYGAGVTGFDDIDEIWVALFATSIETAVAILERTQSAEQEIAGLRTAMKTRSDIDQAKGIIMAMRGISAEDAFALLSEQSQNRNVKVSEIAASMIDSIAEQTVSPAVSRRRTEGTESRPAVPKD